MSFFKKQQHAQQLGYAGMATQLREAGSDLSILDSNVVRRVLSNEGIDSSTAAVANSFSQSVAQLVQQLSIGESLPPARREVCQLAAVNGAELATSPQAVWDRNFQVTPQGTNDVVVSGENIPGYFGKRVASLEAFDNREQRNAVLYSTGFNYAATQQDEFNALIWPVLQLPNDQIGLGIVVNRFTVHRGAQHGVDGAVANFNKVDLVRSVADPDVLFRSRTKVVPVYRAAAADKFVAPAIVAPSLSKEVENDPRMTSYLKIGEEVNIIGLTQTDAQLAKGLRDQTDALDPAISLDKLLISFGQDAISFNTYNIVGANFTPAPQGQEKTRFLNFNSSVLRLTKKTTAVDGSALVEQALKDAATANYVVRFSVNVNGSNNSEFGTTSVNAGPVRVHSVLDANGEVVPSTDPIYQALVALTATAKVEGYKVRAYFTNSNLREIGQYVDTTSFTQTYEVPLLSPITAQRPQGDVSDMNASVFESLAATIRFRQLGDGVTALLEQVQLISEYATNNDPDMTPPAHLGAGRFLVKPYASVSDLADAVDMKAVVDSLTSTARFADITEALVNIIRERAIVMQVASEYEPGKVAQGLTGKTTVILGTTPYVAQYLMKEGDLRTLSATMDLRIATSMDKRLRTKDNSAHAIFMTFGVMEGNRNESVCVLNWGNMVYASEIVASVGMSRGDRYAIETIVQPRYRFVNHLPVCTFFWVKNIDKLVTEKVNVNFKNV